MSGSRVEWKTAEGLQRRLRSLADGLNPQSGAFDRLRADVKAIIEADYRDRLDRGVNRDNKPFAKLAPSTLKNRRRESAPPLGGSSGRFGTSLKISWRFEGGEWRLVARYDGFEAAIYSMTGTSKMPRRDPSGISQAGYAKIRERTLKFVTDLARAGVIQ